MPASAPAGGYVAATVVTLENAHWYHSTAYGGGTMYFSGR
jgi:hypothetical protein